MSTEQYLAAQHSAESLSTGQFIAGLVMLGGAYALAKLMPAAQERIDAHHALMLNRGRRASDRGQA